MAASHSPLVFFGTEAYSVPTLAALLEHGTSIAAVVTKPDTPSGRGRTLTAPAVKTFALEHGLTVLQPERLTDATDQLRALDASAAVLVAYGKIIPAAVLDLFPRGIINIHPSLLPRYRGPAPIEAAILNGDTETGVTLMRLDQGMDTGPVYIQYPVPLTGTETRQQLYDQLFAHGTELLIRHLPSILGSRLQPHPQTTDGATVTRLITKADGQLDWTKPVAELAREIRAYLGWPGSHTTLYGRDVIITAAHVAATLPEPSQPSPAPGTPYRTALGELAVPAADGTLIIDRLKPAGKRDMTGSEFLAGLRA